MKKLIRRIWNGIRKAYRGITGITSEMIPIAINVVEGIKKVMDSQVDDVVLAILSVVFPGVANNPLVGKVKKFVEEKLPSILLNLKIINSIAGIDNPNEQLKAILAQFKLSSDEQKNVAYHEIAYLSMEALADGKITRSEAIVLSEFYYKKILNK